MNSDFSDLLENLRNKVNRTSPRNDIPNFTQTSPAILTFYKKSIDHHHGNVDASSGVLLVVPFHTVWNYCSAKIRSERISDIGF